MGMKRAGKYVREEIEHVREGIHGARSVKQAIAIGLSKARRAGVHTRPSRTRSRAILRALRRESHGSVSRAELSRHAKAIARRRGPRARRRSALAAVRTKGRKGLHRAAVKAARTRRAHRHG